MKNLIDLKKIYEKIWPIRINENLKTNSKKKLNLKWFQTLWFSL